MKPQNFVAKHAKMSGAGQHKCKHGKKVSRARAKQIVLRQRDA
jgi:hypothetical protein